jgi:hypothetical protein
MSLYLGENLISGQTTLVGESRNIGQIIPSAIPLTDAGLHLLDGSLILGNGIYSDFVDYMDNFPLVRGGLWTLVKVLLPATNTVTISELRTRYGGVTRKYVKLK